eukprot:97309-Prymnesium_polylepis.1
MAALAKSLFASFGGGVEFTRPVVSCLTQVKATDVASRIVRRVAASAPLSAAMQLMSENDKGMLIVSEGHGVVIQGLITERDIVQKLDFSTRSPKTVAN